FWVWLQGHISTVEELYDMESHAQLDQLLSPRIKRFGKGLVWELGVGMDKPFSLTISPNGSGKLLPISEAIVSRAPHFDRWEFYSAKPKKHWNLRMELTNRKGQSIELDASRWKYCLTGYEGQRFFDIVLVVHDLPRLDRPALHQAAHLVLEGILGERKMIEHI